MVAPIWCDFNSNHTMNESTMFCFRIPNATHREIVQKDVTALEAELLLFLRQIRSINITVQSPGGDVLNAHLLQRTDDIRAGFRLTELLHLPNRDEDEGTSEKFVVCTHIARQMPHHPKRSGVTESDLLLAFPVDEELRPQLRGRRVYNFLPIRAYGYPFIIQADFILAASREDIEESNPWNDALVAAVRESFLASVRTFNESTILRYTWPQYLRFQPKAQDTAFAGFFDGLIRHLRLQHVLQSETSTTEKPADLQCVRRAFTDGSQPLFPGPSGMRAFAHHSYSFEDLSALGVLQQSSQDFVVLMQDFVKRHPLDFRQKSSAWHSSRCRRYHGDWC